MVTETRAQLGVFWLGEYANRYMFCVHELFDERVIIVHTTKQGFGQHDGYIAKIPYEDWNNMTQEDVERFTHLWTRMVGIL